MSIRIRAVACAAVAALLLSFTAALAADGRNAPTIDSYSAVDINDLYMFRDPPCDIAACTSPNLVVIMSVQSLADPHFGPTYHFQPNALYRFNFDTTRSDGTARKRPVTIDVTFSPFGNNDACPAPNPPCQTYTVTFPRDMIVEGLTTQGSWGATPKPAVVAEDGPITAFAGPREDPAFFDRVGFERFLADFNNQMTTPATPHFNLFTGVDAQLGKNVNAIVLEFPLSLIMPNGSTKFSAWASTYVSGLDAREAGPAADDEDNDQDDHGRDADDLLRQVDREGNPFVNLSLISEPLHDAFNFGLPQNDAKNFAPTIAATLVRDGVDQTHVLPVLATALIPDTLKFDASLPDGYLQVPPNGRKLGDRVTDFLLSLFFNVQGGPGTQHPGGVTCPQLAQTPFSDCTSPKVYLSVFPFAGPPLQQTP